MERTTSQETLQARENELRALLLRGLDGDARAYRAFLDQLGGHLRGFLRRRLPQSDELEDVLQEVLLAVHNARQTYRAEQPLTVWVQAICRYKLTDHYRARGRQAAQTDWLDEADELLAVQDNEQTEARRDLGKLLQQLPPRQRLPIVHVKLEGRSVEETARLTGLSSSAIKVGIHRGLKALAAKIRGGA
ncbi:RNA polymerase subunit sigma [Stutzerimonas frequens]|jgi:RNA polymerase sigma-70 factor (ECF subfamily)|uniref:RNA polymerase sigma factor n=1 Tax=Stutzerimonas stutzeri NF13 TaxID=1212548 RepID=M2VF20_STUST|nr:MULTISPECIES: sigma-70 family RNA polymerase sigma factor [Stutzerimonas stutzeri group]WOF77268.1 sigma-70 family RNA polymerase sigma factor [Pseudomonas sp. FeN3W]AWT12300.1 RNA polymerase subunit sigma [Stutzerimonas frequens]EMD98268.1 RNA polymerase sigma factor [Stutzerimonas stutzeri NF13]MBK3879360.1 sigma-70 family RNA polymerase sigma factor [Stutzerimonas stutzeri]MCQ4292146.1 sigma-70 family RNA polymerase sigma factor [Stutzerimonas stutzeri]